MSNRMLSLTDRGVESFKTAALVYEDKLKKVAKDLGKLRRPTAPILDEIDFMQTLVNSVNGAGRTKASTQLDLEREIELGVKRGELPAAPGLFSPRELLTAIEERKWNVIACGELVEGDEVPKRYWVIEDSNSENALRDELARADRLESALQMALLDVRTKEAPAPIAETVADIVATAEASAAADAAPDVERCADCGTAFDAEGAQRDSGYPELCLDCADDFEGAKGMLEKKPKKNAKATKVRAFLTKLADDLADEPAFKRSAFRVLGETVLRLLAVVHPTIDATTVGAVLFQEVIDLEENAQGLASIIRQQLEAPTLKSIESIDAAAAVETPAAIAVSDERTNGKKPAKAGKSKKARLDAQAIRTLNA